MEYNVDNYWNDERQVYVKDEEDFDSVDQLIHNGFFDFCCCGMPDASLRFIWEVLYSLDYIWQAKEMPQEEWSSRWKAWEEKQKDVNAVYFLYYWLDNEGFTEHGGSVPGWLTSDGEDLLYSLNKIFNNGQEEEN